MTISELYPIYREHPQVCTDTRRIMPGSLFFCLKGGRFDGNTFAGEALSKGAAYAVVDNPSYATDERCLLVDDVLRTLQQLAAYHRGQMQIPVIGITGTNGKTTTKELVTAVLSRKYRVCSTQGNLNNHIGVPLTLLSITPETELAVVEMGASHPGEIAELCEMAGPDFGLITNVGKAHLEGFGTMDEVLRTKTALYRSVARKNGVIFVSADDDLLMRQAVPLSTVPNVPSLNPWYLEQGFGPDWVAGAEQPCLVTYGMSEGSQCRALSCDNGLFLRFDWQAEGAVYPVQTHLVGGYNLPNALAACAVGSFFAVPPAECVAALEAYTPANSRSQVIDKGAVRIVMDAYNANPSSMEEALRNFSRIPAERAFPVLGDMCELGRERLREHEKVVQLLQTLGFSMAFLYGAEFAGTSAPEGWKFDDFEKLKQALAAQLRNGPALMLVKGSRAMRMERVLEIFS